MEDKIMKKVFGIAALLLALVACNKIEIQDQPIDNADGIPFSATVSLANNAATKALTENGSTITASWAVGETVALIHNGVSDEMTVSSVSGGSATITGTITGSPANGDAVTIIYPSSAADGTTGNIKADLLYTQNGLLTGEGSISENFDARKGEGTLKVDGTATLSGSVSLTNQFAIFKFTVKNYNGSAAISAKPLTITIGTQDYVITPASATDVLYAALPAVSGENVSFDATDGSDRTYTCAKLSVSFEAGKYYQSTLKMREYVDLGIIVDRKKIKWATCNVGASKPEEYGDYFAWGATVPFYAEGHSQDNPCSDWISGKTGYNWASYPFMQSGQSAWNYITKYTFADEKNAGIWYGGSSFIGDNKTVLDFEDDAARANWGGSWRMPTSAEMDALLALSGEWVAYEDVNGYKFTGGNGKTLFLPAAGCRYDALFNFAGINGYYWSSSLHERGSDYAVSVLFRSGKAGSYDYLRYYGFSVRPVSD